MFLVKKAPKAPIFLCSFENRGGGSGLCEFFGGGGSGRGLGGGSWEGVRGGL